MLALDHLVISVKDAEKANEYARKHLSIKAIKGGNHEQWGTYNYLAYFSNTSYIEWLAIHDEDKARTQDNPLIQHLLHIQQQKSEPTTFQFALSTNQLDSYVEHFKQEQIPFKGPFNGHRVKPDGTELRWRMLFPNYDFKTEMLPFLIEWETPNKMPGLDNSQIISKIYYGGTSKEKFSHIYKLKNRKIHKNMLRLQNTKLYFTDQTLLSYELS